MLQKLDRFAQTLNKWLINIACFFLVSVIVCCVIQVLTRFVPFITITGTEELARYSFIWMVFLGASAAVGFRSHPAMSFVRDMLPKRFNVFFDVVAQLSILIFGVIFVRYGITAAANVSKVVSTSFQINMVYIYASAVIGGALMVFNAANNLIQDFAGRRKEVEENAGGTAV